MQMNQCLNIGNFTHPGGSDCTSLFFFEEKSVVYPMIIKVKADERVIYEHKIEGESLRLNKDPYRD